MDRYQQGLNKLKMVLGENGVHVVESIAKISPDLARLYVEVPFTDIYSRGLLDIKTRELIAIAALTCLGDVDHQLESHAVGALNVGCSPDEIKEAVIQMTVFAGFPRAINSIKVIEKVFKEQKVG